jgi:hypothetical protein
MLTQTRSVMPALVASIHGLVVQEKAWMAGPSPAMTAAAFRGE